MKLPKTFRAEKDLEEKMKQLVKKPYLNPLKLKKKHSLRSSATTIYGPLDKLEEVIKMIDDYVDSIPVINKNAAERRIHIDIEKEIVTYYFEEYNQYDTLLATSKKYKIKNENT